MYHYRRHFQGKHGRNYKLGKDSLPHPGNQEQPHPSEPQPPVEPRLVQEGVEDILKELLPPGCLSPMSFLAPLPSKPPPTKRAKKQAKQQAKACVLSPEVRKQPGQQTKGHLMSPEVDKHPEPAHKVKLIPMTSTLPEPETTNQQVVIDARYTGKVPYKLIPIDCATNIRSRGKDLRIEGLILKNYKH